MRGRTPAAGEERAGNGLSGRFPRRPRPGEAVAAPRLSGLNLPRLTAAGLGDGVGRGRSALSASPPSSGPARPPPRLSRLCGRAAAAAGPLLRLPAAWAVAAPCLDPRYFSRPRSPPGGPRLCSWREREASFPCGDGRCGVSEAVRAAGREGRTDGRTDRLPPPPPGSGGQRLENLW